MLEAIESYQARMFLMLDHEMRLVWANRMASVMLGYQIDDVLGRHSWEFLHPDDAEPVMLELLKHAEDSSLISADFDNERISSAVLRLRRADGSYITCSMSSRNLLDDPGVGGFLVQCTPVADRVTTDEILSAIGTGKPVADTLAMICHYAEAWLVGSSAAITARVGDSLVEAGCLAAPTGEHGESGPIWIEPIVSLGSDGAVGVLRVSPAAGAQRLIGQDRILTSISQLAAVAVSVASHAEVLRCAAELDPLTRLANRARLDAELSGLGSSDPFTALAIDLDGFKPVNDRWGHAVGDGVLIEVGRRLVANVGPNDLVARSGGDEFVVIVAGQRTSTEINEIEDRLADAVAKTIVVDGATVSVTASVGSASRVGSESVESVLDRADRSSYACKRSRVLR